MSWFDALLAPFTNQGLLIELVLVFGLYLMMASSLDLAVGYGGLFQLGHIAFFALGAVGTTFATHPDHFAGDAFLGILFGMLLSSIAVVAVGLPTLRLRGDYFAIATLGLGVMVQFVLAGYYANGIFGVPTFNPFGCDIRCMQDGWMGSIFGRGGQGGRLLELVLVWIVALLAHGLLGRIKRSPFGRVLKSIREDPLAAAAMGKDVPMLRLQALWISAIFASLAGSMTVHHFQIMSPLSYGFPFMVIVLVMVILGGLGAHQGALVGALLVTFVNQFSVGITEALKETGAGSYLDLSSLRIILFALVLITMMLLRPRGILGGRDLRLRDLIRGRT